MQASVGAAAAVTCGMRSLVLQVGVALVLASVARANMDMDLQSLFQQAQEDPVQATSCDFESGLCGWTQSQDDDFDWLVYGGRPARVNSGPTFDHTPGVGRNYLLMNATGRSENQKVQLISPEFPAVSGLCIRFYYHMQGRTMGILKIYQVVGGDQKVVFQRDGDQGSGIMHSESGWHPGRINLESPSPFQLVIEGTVGWAERSYIAIDDIVVTDAVCPDIPASCGLSNPVNRTRRIINGVDSLPQQWPWQVLIKIYMAALGKEHQCGGTLIDRQWVLTAAHCIEDMTNGNSMTNRESIRLIFDMNQASWEPEEFSVHPSELIIHGDREVQTDGMGPHDLLLMKLPYPLTLDENVSLACLPEDSDIPEVGTQCVISGMGREHYTEGSSNKLQHAQVSILADSICRNYHGAELFLEDNICAGSPINATIDACAGDSGGPLVCPKDGKYVLTGVVSFGSKCGFHTYGTPGIYANVAYYRNWIDSHIQT